MTEQECLAKMVPPGARRKGKYREGVIQIHLTRSCNLSCFNCTQGSNFGGRAPFMRLAQFEEACQSLKGYWGVVGIFGGNPATHPDFPEVCAILRKHFPRQQCGLWCNDIISEEKAQAARETFDPSISNLNVHLDREAWDRFKRWWPEARPFGLTEDSRHAPVYVAMKDVIGDESRIYELISTCDINQHWSALLGVFRGQLRAWFCEVAGAQAMLHQDEPDYPDTGFDPTMRWDNFADNFGPWWTWPMRAFANQVRKHCFDCGVPLRGYGELAQSKTGKEQFSATHAGVCKPKRPNREVELVTDLQQLGVGRLTKTTDYMGNAKR